MLRSGRGALPFARCQSRMARTVRSWDYHPAASLHLKLPSASPTVPSRYPSKRITNPFPRSVRHCSHRRTLNMCKHFGHEADATSSIDVTKGREVLPKNVKPLHYDLTLEPKLDGDFSYEGTVVIECVSPSCTLRPAAR